MSKMPAQIEELRSKYKVIAYMFLLAKMRQPSRNLYRDVEVTAVSDFLDELLSDRNFFMESDDDEKFVIPPWNQCLNYEFSIRMDVVRLCLEEGFSIKDALWHTLADKEHRMQHWILKLTIANSRQNSSKAQKLEQRLTALEKQRRRSLASTSAEGLPPSDTRRAKGRRQARKGPLEVRLLGKGSEI